MKNGGGGPVHLPGLPVGCAGAANKREHPVAVTWVEDHVLLQVRQVHRLVGLRSAEGRACRGADVRLGDRAGAGPGRGHRGRGLVPARVHGRRRGGDVRGERLTHGGPACVVFVSSGYHTRSDGSGTLCGPIIDDVSFVSVSSQP
jgi:hypothetical protein